MPESFVQANIAFNIIVQSTGQNGSVMTETAFFARDLLI